jgi:hypothetical protein
MSDRIARRTPDTWDIAERIRYVSTWKLADVLIRDHIHDG